MNVHEWSGKSRSISQRKQVRTEGKRSMKKPMPKPHETEEEAIIRRFHDAQRMARFRARKKKAMEEARTLEIARLAEISLISELKKRNITFQLVDSASPISIPEKLEVSVPVVNSPILRQSSHEQSKYFQLLTVIEELGKDVKLSYAGSRSSAERLKTGIVQARMLIKDCLAETETNSRQ